MARVSVPGPVGQPSETVQARHVGKGVYRLQEPCFEDNPLQVQAGDHVLTESSTGMPVAIAPVEKGLLGRIFG